MYPNGTLHCQSRMLLREMVCDKPISQEWLLSFYHFVASWSVGFHKFVQLVFQSASLPGHVKYLLKENFSMSMPRLNGLELKGLGTHCEF